MADPSVPEQKQCTKCGECKKSSEFYRRANGYFAGACKACTAKAAQDRIKLRALKRSQEAEASQIALDLGAPGGPSIVTKTCRLCRQVKPRSEFEQYTLRTRWGFETTRYTFTCRHCVAAGPKNRRRPKTEKRCIYCNEIKPATAFHSHNYTTKTGKNSRRLMSGCKECKGRYTKVWRNENKDHIAEVTRDWRARNKVHIVERDKAYYDFNKERILNWSRKHAFRTKYGLTLEEHAAMIAQQDGKCLICGEEPDPTLGKKKKGLHVDHCHESGKVRGLLCHNCNCAIGLLKDDPQRIRRLLEYIEAHRNDVALSDPV